MKRKDRKPAKISRIMIGLMRIAGVCSLAYYAALLLYLGFGLNFALFWAALGLLCLGLSWALGRVGRKSRKAQKRLSAALAALIAAALALFIGVTARVVAGSFAKPAPNADYMLVLGARVKENGPSVLLEFRIEKAAEYLAANENTVAILCGGQGANEPMSEAQSIYEGLVARGIDPNRLVIEDRSTSTEENIAFAKAFISDEAAPVVITTTGYHIYRALQTARSLGLKNVTGNPSRCAWITPVNYYTREFFAVARDWIAAR